jgi:hypothetical protein
MSKKFGLSDKQFVVVKRLIAHSEAAGTLLLPAFIFRFDVRKFYYLPVSE